MLQPNSEKYLGRLLLIGLTLVTVAVYSAGVTDPVNVPKLFILGGFVFSGIAIFSIRDWKVLANQYQLFLLIVLTFLLASFNSMFRSNAPLSQSLYGAYGRNNGFLLYFFLILLLIVSLFSSQKKTFQSILNALYIAGIVNVIYCLWVVFFGDFIGWSNPYGNILGTLGNPNFIGSFLGMFSALLLSKIFWLETTRKSMAINALLLIATLYLIYESHAVQGRVLFVGALFINLFYLSRSRFNSNTPSIFVVAGGAIFAVLGVLGTLQKGPFAGILYKDSVSLRGQYWFAGVEMGKSNLFSGVGFDSFGDWYRGVRRASALVRPGVEVTSNAAHNVFIDMFAFGGLPLLISYVGIVIVVLVSILRFTAFQRNFDPIFVGLVGVWICYLLQSIISINQIGLAIWGWSIAGAIVAYTKISMSKSKALENPNKPRNAIDKKLNSGQWVSPGLRGGIGLVIGLLISIPPLSGDMKWRSAQLSRDAFRVEQALKPSYMNPLNSFRYVNTIGVFIDSGLPDLALKYTNQATQFNPRSYESWRLYTFLNNATDTQRQIAISKMKRLDPLNPSILETTK